MKKNDEIKPTSVEAVREKTRAYPEIPNNGCDKRYDDQKGVDKPLAKNQTAQTLSQ